VKYKILALVLSLFLLMKGSHAQTIKLKQIGKPNILFNITSAYVERGVLYNIDNTGTIYKTKLDSGEHSSIGNAAFKNAKFIFGINGRVYVIETDGSMDQIDPVSGTWNVVASMGTWTLPEKVLTVNNHLFTIENASLMYYPILNPKMRKQRGESNFADVGFLMRTDTTLHSLIADGSLYKINVETGEWTKILKNKILKNTRAGTVFNNKLYTSENSAGLVETSLPDGARKELDPKIQRARMIFSDSGKLYLVDNDGTLYEVILN
jgi:hypothetical protein